MGNFRSNNRGGGFSGRSSGSRFGGRGGGFRDRDEGRGGFGRDSERRPVEMHDVVCSKCGKNCQVPFKPTGSKPVYCSDCFSQNEDSGNHFNSRNRDRSSNSGASSEQFNQINTKLDKIIKILQELEIDADDDSENYSEEDSDNS